MPVISDALTLAFESGSIHSVSAIRKILSADKVELLDGTCLKIDVIIFCTGYKISFDILDPKCDPTAHTTSQWLDSVGSNGKPLPRLYQNLLSLQYPESLAFMSSVAFPAPAFQTYDLASMALAQIWKGRSSLPTQSEMEKGVDEHHTWVCGLAQRGSVYPGIVKPGEWMRSVNEATGTGVNEKLGYGIKGWVFWLREKKFCDMLMKGVFSPHVFRVFEGNKRKGWGGARAAIEKANESVKAVKIKTVRNSEVLIEYHRRCKRVFYKSANTLT